METMYWIAPNDQFAMRSKDLTSLQIGNTRIHHYRPK